MLLAALNLVHHAVVSAGTVELSGPCANAQPLAGPLRCTSVADCVAQCDEQAAAVNGTRHDQACVAVDTDGQNCWLRASCDGKPGSCAGPICGYHSSDDWQGSSAQPVANSSPHRHEQPPNVSAPGCHSGCSCCHDECTGGCGAGCCSGCGFCGGGGSGEDSCVNFAGVWTTQEDGKGIAYKFTQAAGSCSIETPSCPRHPVGNGTRSKSTSLPGWYSVWARGNVIHTCEEFHGGVAGVLQLREPRDRLRWATGASWWRVHNEKAPPAPPAPPSPPPVDYPSDPTVWRIPYKGGPWTAVIDDMTSQLVECVGGASFSSWPRGEQAVMRGGSRTDARPMCRLKVAAPEKILSATLSYKYVAGYNCTQGCARATVMKLLATDADFQLPRGHGLMYKSAPLNGANGEDCDWTNSCYKQMDANTVCEECAGRYFTFAFENDQHNVQLLLPISITINERTVCHPRRKPYENPTAHQARSCALAHSRKECIRFNQTCIWDSVPDSSSDSECKGFGCLRTYGLPAILCGMCLLLMMVGTVGAARTRAGVKRGPPLLPTNPSDDDGTKKQRVNPTTYGAGSAASYRTPPENQFAQTEASSASWSGSTDAGATAAPLMQDDDLISLFAQYHEETDTPSSSTSLIESDDFDALVDAAIVGEFDFGDSFDETVAALAGSAGPEEPNVSVESPAPWVPEVTDADQAASFGVDGLFADDFPAVALSDADLIAFRQRKEPVILTCWREGCSYTTTQQRHLNAHESR